MKTPLPKPEPPKQHAVQRLKYIWRAFLITNLALGAYMFGMARKRDMSIDKKKNSAAKGKSGPVHEDSTPVTEEPPPAPVIEEPAATPIAELIKEPAATPIAELIKERTPLHEEEKRELFGWMLEEKRKIKPNDRLEKKCIDEDKAILKQFIRAESIPDL